MSFPQFSRGSSTGHSEKARARFIRHFTATHQIDVIDEHSARGRAYYAVLTDRGLDHWGRYKDIYRFENDSWHFASRRVSVDGRVPGGWADRNLAKL